ncbi:stalk domain-containing protein [Syntrophomonas erecta]
MKHWKLWSLVGVVSFVIMLFAWLPPASANQPIRIFIDGREIDSQPAPVIINDYTMVPMRAISEGLGMKVDWDQATRSVIITSPSSSEGTSAIPILDTNIPIMGKSVATAEQLRILLRQNNPYAPDLVDLYLQIGAEYGVRGDIAFCQAAKETGWWRFGGLVTPDQNNYCGLGATGSPATGEEDLRGADPSRVRFEAGVHGAIFDTPATGVEAHIQHLLAYATTDNLPVGKNIVDPRFTLVRRGSVSKWIDLGGKWAVPGYNRDKYASYTEAFAQGDTYGHSILFNYYLPALNGSTTTNGKNLDRVQQLELENERLRVELEQLKRSRG